MKTKHKISVTIGAIIFWGTILLWGILGMLWATPGDSLPRSDVLGGLFSAKSGVSESPAGSNTFIQPVSPLQNLGGGGIDDPSLILTPPPLSNPPAGQPITDPVFGTTLMRLIASGGNNYSTHTYSQLQAFSSDNSHVLLIEDDWYTVRRMSDLSLVNLDTSSWNAPRWHPTLPDTIVHFDTNGDTTVRLQFTEVSSGATTTRFTFPAAYDYVRVGPSHEEMSRDGRWVSGMLTRNDGETAIFTLDLQTDTLASTFTISSLYNSGPCVPDPDWGIIEPDWVGTSPLGNYLIIQWPADGTSRCNGLETFDLNTGNFVGRPYDGHSHGDLALLDDGTTEVFVTFELYHPSGNLSIGYRELPGPATGVGSPTYIQVMDWHGEHISCQGPAGVCLVTTNAYPDNGWTALEGEVFLQYLDGSVLRLAHHRSSSCGYWVQPRGSISKDGNHIIFASDWDGASCNGGNGGFGAGDTYIVDLSNESPPEPTDTPTPTNTPGPTPTGSLFLPSLPNNNPVSAPAPTVTVTPPAGAKQN